MEEEKIKIYDNDSSMDSIKKIMNAIDPEKDSKYFKEIWDDLERYDKKNAKFEELKKGNSKE